MSSIHSSLRSPRRQRLIAEMNVVPYIDVMLVLLVIFMVTAPLVTPSVIDLPRVGQATPQMQPPPLIVRVHKDGALSIREHQGRNVYEQRMTQEALEQFLRTRQPTTPAQPVVIAADKNIPYQTVMNVMSALKAQGVQRIGLLVQSQ